MTTNACHIRQGHGSVPRRGSEAIDQGNAGVERRVAEAGQHFRR